MRLSLGINRCASIQRKPIPNQVVVLIGSDFQDLPRTLEQWLELIGRDGERVPHREAEGKHRSSE